MKFFAITLVLMVVPCVFSENIFLLDVKPEEAQKYIAAQSLDLKYAPKLGENPPPVLRDADGDFVYMGRKLSNPSDYVEEHYLANQYHGQDGLGRYGYGYSDWAQGKAEARNINGEVRGAYKYKQPYGKEFVANYWADDSGFHQEDNRPKELVEPVTDTPEVRRAREEHFRLWHELAEANKNGPDPYSNGYDQANEVRGAASEKQYETAEPKEWKYVPTEEEATSEPRGFFYKFDYEVPLLRHLQERTEFDQNRSLDS